MLCQLNMFPNYLGLKAQKGLYVILNYVKDLSITSEASEQHSEKCSSPLTLFGVLRSFAELRMTLTPQ